MRALQRGVVCMAVVVLVSGCASTKVTSRERLVNQPLARPDRILVYHFAATAAEVPGDSAMAGQYAEAPLTADEIREGRELGELIARELAERIRDMGLAAVDVPTGTPPRIGDIVIRGYLFSMDEGSTTKRMLIGFGSGGSELKTMVEGYQMTARGLRKLGSGSIDAGGSKGPGAVAPAAVAVATGNPIGLIVTGGMKIYGEASGSSRLEGRAKGTAKEIAEVLESRFQEEGWIE